MMNGASQNWQAIKLDRVTLKDLWQGIDYQIKLLSLVKEQPRSRDSRTYLEECLVSLIDAQAEFERLMGGKPPL
jgi:hypothetical protein